MTAALETLSDENGNLLQRAAHPAWCAPMLATLTDDYFSNPGWTREKPVAAPAAA